MLNIHTYIYLLLDVIIIIIIFLLLNFTFNKVIFYRDSPNKKFREYMLDSIAKTLEKRRDTILVIEDIDRNNINEIDEVFSIIDELNSRLLLLNRTAGFLTLSKDNLRQSFKKGDLVYKNDSISRYYLNKVCYVEFNFDKYMDNEKIIENIVQLYERIYVEIFNYKIPIIKSKRYLAKKIVLRDLSNMLSILTGFNDDENNEYYVRRELESFYNNRKIKYRYN